MLGNINFIQEFLNINDFYIVQFFYILKLILLFMSSYFLIFLKLYEQTQFVVECQNYKDILNNDLTIVQATHFISWN